MEIPELPDYVIFCPSQNVFVMWDGSKWCGTKNESHANTFTKNEAMLNVEDIIKKHPCPLEVRSREKYVGITVVKA